MHEDKGAAAVAAMMKTAEEHGGVYEEPEAYRDACARTLFDRPNAEDGTVAVLIPRARMADVPLGALVRIDSFDARTRTLTSFLFLVSRAMSCGAILSRLGGVLLGPVT